jgi:hypothetical protein
MFKLSNEEYLKNLLFTLQTELLKQFKEKMVENLHFFRLRE